MVIFWREEATGNNITHSTPHLGSASKMIFITHRGCHPVHTSSSELATNTAYERNACSIFRPWQGWTALSSTGPSEGTLRVFPNLSTASAYVILRPFFRPKNPRSDSLAFNDWELDLDSSRFPGSSIGKTQELNEKSHPHLQLDKTMSSIPKVEPGDQVYCKNSDVCLGE